jgi:hypothetical protein
MTALVLNCPFQYFKVRMHHPPFEPYNWLPVWCGNDQVKTRGIFKEQGTRNKEQGEVEGRNSRF